MHQESGKYIGKLRPVPELSGDTPTGYGWFTDGRRNFYSSNPDIRAKLSTHGKIEVVILGDEITQAIPVLNTGLKERFIGLIKRRK